MPKLLRSRGFPFLVFALLTGVALGAAWIAGEDMTEQARFAARWTARAALPLFLLTYVARPLAQLRPSDLTRALLSRRRQWGLAFAAAHSVHFVALVTALRLSGEGRPLFVYIGGGLAYGLVWAAAATSNTASMRVMGKGWKMLHLAMIHYVWLIFFQSYAGRIFKPETMPQGVIFAGLLLLAAGVRFAAWRRKARA